MNREIEPSPKKIKALDNYLLYIEFENGERKIFDMKKILIIFVKRRKRGKLYNKK